MMFYALFWIVLLAFFILLLKGGVHIKIQNKTRKFIDENFDDEKENV